MSDMPIKNILRRLPYALLYRIWCIISEIHIERVIGMCVTKSLSLRPTLPRATSDAISSMVATQFLFPIPTLYFYKVGYGNIGYANCEGYSTDRAPAG